MSNRKITDLTPKNISVKPAMIEMSMPDYTMPIGQTVGGAQMFNKSFKRGYGNRVFGSDDNGIWLGAADFGNAPFRVDMNGNVTAISATLTNYLTEDGEDQELSGDINVGNTTGGYVNIDGPNKRILIHDGTNPRIVMLVS